MAETPPNLEPTSFSHADFIATVAGEANVDPGQLTQRKEPEPELTDPLLLAARQASAEHSRRYYESLEGRLDLRTQYIHELTTLERLGLRGGIEGVDGRHYDVPTYEQIAAALSDEIEAKVSQGFTKLVLVPLAMPLGDLIERAKQDLLRLKADDTLKEELNEEEPFWVWDQYNEADVNGTLKYFPAGFNESEAGLNKVAAIRAYTDATPGWQVLLLEDLPELPREGEGAELNGRLQFETNKTPNEYLDEIQHDTQNTGEIGITPEAYIMATLRQIRETGAPLDVDTATYLTATYFPGGGSVPCAYWYRGYRRARLGASDPGDADPYIGVRSAVRVT